MKKKFLSVLLIVCIIAGMTMTAFAVSGKGTKENPFRIGTAEELLLLADFPDCYFELENDIELTDAWTPIENFSGVFDGKGHTITVSSYKNADNIGFFSALSGTVKNLTVNADNTKLPSSSYNANCVGLIAGVCSGTIKNCNITGNLTCVSYGYTLQIGGICGELSGTVNQCMNSANIVLKPYKEGSNKAYIYYGNIAFQINTKGSVINSVGTEESITSDNLFAYYSGIANYNYGNITNCYCAGGKDLKVTSKFGISRGGTMTNCYFDKTVFSYDSSSTTYGIPKSTLAMKMEATYENWDFDTVWAIDESEENPINGGYPYLRAFYATEDYPVTSSTVSVAGNNLIIDCKIKDVSDTYVVHVAFYDADNKLCDYCIIPNNRELKDVFVVARDDGQAQYAKIFTWSALNMIEPIAVSERVEIVR